jgi:hypothetical protein
MVERKIEVKNPIAVALLVILAVVVMAFVVLTNALPFISSGIKLGHNTDMAFMWVNARAGDEVTIHYDVDVYNGSLEMKFLKGAFSISAEEIWDLELKSGKVNDSAVITIPEDGLYQVHVQEYSYGGIYNINWTVASNR